MITVRAIDHINFRVKNLKETIEFYNSVFGFKVKERGETDDGQIGRASCRERV